MATTHDVHRRMEENLFGAFSRQRHQTSNSLSSFLSSSNNNNVSSGGNSSYRSLTASDLISLPSSINYQQRRHIATSVTNPANPNSAPMPLQYKCRPSSDILHAQPTTMRSSDNTNSSPEAEAIDRWFENIQRYEQMLEEVAAASLDQGFKDELHHINQWLRCRSDAERTATLYTVVQNASQIQIRFLITVLQQLASNSYPAGQDLTNSVSCNNSEVQQQQRPQQQQQYHYYNNLFSNASSVISSDSSAERKRQLYPPLVTPSLSTSNRRRCSPPSFPSIPQKFSGAASEPGRATNSRDLFSSRPLTSGGGGLSHPGPLYEKALAARAQLQALNGHHSSTSTISSTTNSTLSSSSSSSLSSANAPTNNNTGGLFSSPPRLRSRKSSKSLFSASSASGDWPFPSPSPTLKENSDWSFGSLGNTKKKEDSLPWAIQEEVVIEGGDSCLSTLNQAQARLRQDKVISPPSPARYAAASVSTANVIGAPLTPAPVVSKTLPSFLPAQAPSSPVSQQESTEEDGDDDDGASDTGEKPLTGLARRRKRSSTARALKDKIAAETVDFDLMKDVQNWLRSLRLHKYGHAFIGLDWKQVVRLSDQDMIDNGVNTIGARRKLLKVFENVQRHCIEHGIEF